MGCVPSVLLTAKPVIPHQVALYVNRAITKAKVNASHAGRTVLHAQIKQYVGDAFLLVIIWWKDRAKYVNMSVHTASMLWDVGDVGRLTINWKTVCAH